MSGLLALVATLALLPGPFDPILRESPTVDRVLPRGGQRGTEVAVTFHGDRLADAADILFCESGIELLSLETPDEKHSVARLRIAPDCTLGEHKLRLRTRTGISELRTFWVGPFPCVDEIEPNNDFTQLQAIGRNVTLQGTVTNEDVDCFVVEMKAGERLSVEVEGLRLAETLFDPFVAILDERRFELASCDDSSLFRQDPVTSCIVPADGRYVVLLRDSAFGGSERSRYRLHVGTFPRPLVAFPAGGRQGSDLSLRLLGDVKGELLQTLHVPEGGPSECLVYPEQEGTPAPSGIALRVAAVDSVSEVEPDDTGATATPVGRGPPLAVDGILDHPGDVDWLRIPLKKDERVHVRVNARSVRSPLDPVLSIHAADERQLDAVDDVIGLDSYLQFSAPADGDYLVRIADHLGAGGPTYVWRLVVAPVIPSLNLDLPRFGRDPQARQMVPVPRGNRYATVVHAGRGSFGGDLQLSAEGLPAGVKLTAVPMAKAFDTTLLLFEAAADAPLEGRLVDLAAECAEPKVRGRLRQKFDLVIAPPNETNFYDVTLDRLAVAVTEEAPFELTVEPPKTPLVHGGVLPLKVHVTRRAGFDAAVVIRMLWLPPGVGSQPTQTLAQGQSDLVYQLNANGEAPLGTYSLALLGEAETGRGVVLCASALTPLTVAAPFLTMKLDLAAAEQGQKVQVVAHVEPLTPFEGKATVHLHGLPAKCSAEDREITAADTTLVFDVTTAADTPVGKHTSLFCQVNVPLAGELVVHYLGGGGVLRIDPPAPVAAAAPAPPPEPPKPTQPEVAPAAPPKPLSRLEQLRLDAKKRAESQAGGGAPPPAPAAPAKPPGGQQR